MIKEKIAIIGFGNMGQAIAQRLIREEVLDINKFIKIDKEDDPKLVSQTKIVILSVKPDVLKKVLGEIKNILKEDAILISVVAGVDIKTLSKFLKRKSKIIRAMPNINAAVGKSLTFWVKSPAVSENDQKLVIQVFDALGEQYEVTDEGILDKVTALSGSGPAYFFYLVGLLEKSARKFGLSNELAELLARQTFIGSARMLRKSDIKVEQLIKKVASEGGTTETVLNFLEKQHFSKVFTKALSMAITKIKSLKINKEKIN